MLLFLFVVKENKTLDSYSLGLGRFVIVGVWNAIKRRYSGFALAGILIAETADRSFFWLL